LARGKHLPLHWIPKHYCFGAGGHRSHATPKEPEK
jgi:hypothetical protein